MGVGTPPSARMLRAQFDQSKHAFFYRTASIAIHCKLRGDGLEHGFVEEVFYSQNSILDKRETGAVETK